MLTIYRRHRKVCAHRSEGRTYRRCKCPIWTDGFLTGREIRKSLATRDWECAQELVRQWESEGRGPLPGAIERAEPMTISRACEQFLADARARNLCEGTLRNYVRLLGRLERFAESLGVRAIGDLKLLHLVKFRGAWSQNNLTALKQLERLRSFFRFAHDNGWVKENLGSRLKSPRVAPAPTLPFTQDEMQAILRAAAGEIEKGRPEAKSNNLRLRALILFLRYSGLRIGDAVGCSVERVSDGKLRLYTQKTGTHVHCPLPEFVVKELDATPRRSERYWFWSGIGKLQTAVTDWQTRLRELFAAAGLENGHAHRFRDTFAVDLLLAGVPLERVSITLGHSSVRITEKHYSPWVRERQEQVEADVRRSWLRDPIVIMGNAAIASDETKGTQEVRGKLEPVM